MRFIECDAIHVWSGGGGGDDDDDGNC